jgi:DnaK suppressor protein
MRMERKGQPQGAAATRRWRTLLATAKSKSKTVSKTAKATVKKAAPKGGKLKNAKLAPKVAVKAKTTSKSPPKSAKKTPPKTAKKTAAKIAAKPVAKKPVAKPAAKKPTAQKPTANKQAAKPVAKPVTKPVGKTAAKAVTPVGTAAKPKASNVASEPAKPSAPAAKAAVHAVAPVLATSPLGVASVPTARPAPKPSTPEKSTVFKFTPSTVKEGGVMSEAELLKQPKADYMNKQQLAFFKHRLLTLQSQLRENAGATTEHLREIAVAPDPADRATLEEEHALELRTRDRERKLLKKVESALERIADNSYGYCEETGEPIGIPRLLARPTATLTIEAQERRELKQKLYGE